jgi:hypothetical protein
VSVATSGTVTAGGKNSGTAAASSGASASIGKKGELGAGLIAGIVVGVVGGIAGSTVITFLFA